MARLDKATVFYATSEEMSHWLREWGCRYSLHAIAGRVFPEPAVVTIAGWDDPETIRQLVTSHATFCLSLKPMNADVTSINQVPRQNPDCLTIHVPKETPDALGYGAISSVATDQETVQVWEAILHDLLASTEMGAWYGVPKQKKQTFERSVRFTSEANRLLQSGTQIVGGGKTFVVRFGVE